MKPHKGALIMAVDNPAALTSVMPNAKHVRHRNKELVLVKHTLDSTKLLRNMGLNAPTPMLHDGYIWPKIFGEHEAMSHQIQTADFATVNHKLFILNGTGTGKTGAALWASDYLIERGYVKRVLIVCPLSVIQVWKDELFGLLPKRTTGVLTGGRDKRIKVLESGVEYCIINFDGLAAMYTNDKKRKKKSCPLKDRFDLIIVDEASTYRNAATDRYEALSFINTLKTRLWMMTATPTPNAPTDAWATTRLVSPSRVPDSFTLFRETVMQPAGPYKWVPRIGAEVMVRNVMQPAIRFEKKDCLDLPSLTYNDRYCELEDEQKEMFNIMKAKLKHEDEDGNSITAANAAVKILKLQQICCGVVKDDEKNPVYLKCNKRLKLLLELIEQSQNKVIVFVPFIFSMHMIMEFLQKHHISCALVNGQVPGHERAKIFTAFQQTETPRVLVAHPAVAAHGLTLTAADTIIWYAPIYSLEQYEQANARIERHGQKNIMSVYHMISHPFEAAIFNVLRKKGSVQSALLNLYREVTG